MENPFILFAFPESRLNGSKWNSRYTIFRGSIYEFVRVNKVDKTIGISIIKSDNSKFLEEKTRGFFPDLLYWFDRVFENNVTGLATCYRCITRIFCYTDSTSHTTLLCSTIKTCYPADLRIWYSSYFYFMIWSENLKCCIDRSYLIWIRNYSRESSGFCCRLSCAHLGSATCSKQKSE